MVLRESLGDSASCRLCAQVGTARGGQGRRVGGGLQLRSHHGDVAEIHGKGDHSKHHDKQHRGQYRNDAAAIFPDFDVERLMTFLAKRGQTRKKRSLSN